MRRAIPIFATLWLFIAPAALAAVASDATSLTPIEELRAHLRIAPEERTPLSDLPFAATPLTRPQADEARKLLIDDWRKRLRKERQPEVSAHVISLDEREMRFFAKTFGGKPANGRSLFISMHGGGNTPARVNDQQWRNQQRLYEPDEGVYVAPRAPSNSWNLWHEPQIDNLFDRLVEDMVVCEDVDPNRVYIMGYSAGGDGVYQLAPRMADRWAAAAMMAGHPNEAQPLGLRNVPFALHIGALDDGYGRNKIAGEWRDKLKALHEADPDGYEHVVEFHADKGHWMDREDAIAVPWMAKFTRNPFPKRIVWLQDDITHRRFYWLAVAREDARTGAEVRANVDGQTIQVDSDDVHTLSVRVVDELVDLDQDVVIRAGDRELFHGKIPRTIAAMSKSLAERGDPTSVFFGEQTVRLAP